jgi:DNA (cytosine-5)-methyltransferase 3A
MNVLSLFDGMSCGQQALERAGIKVDKYFASEIDKYAIQVTMANYPNTNQLGSVVNVDGYSLPKIDILIGGSPCQSFSFAGKRKGMSTKDEQEILTLNHYLELKYEGFEFEGQSYLFWEYMRLLNEVKPKYFLLENVMMGEKWEKVLSKAIGVKPIMINSALLSAQNRQRLYWTNIGLEPQGLFGDLDSIIDQPKDKGILLKDILEHNVSDKYFLTEKGVDRISSYNNSERSLNDNGKSLCLAAGYFKQGRDNQLVVDSSINNNMVFNNKRLNQTISKHQNDLKHGTLIDSYNQSIHNDKSITISTRVNASCQTHIVDNQKILGGDFRYDEGFRWRENGKSGTLATKGGGSGSDISGCALAKLDNSTIRRLTPIECERLQTVNENYTAHVSDSQRYKMLGNGWTVDVIVHILNYIK